MEYFQTLSKVQKYYKQNVLEVSKEQVLLDLLQIISIVRLLDYLY